MSSTIMHPSIGTGRTTQVGRQNGLLVRLVVAWFDLRAKQRSRHQLAQLDPRLLRDIGIDRASAFEESQRSMWR